MAELTFECARRSDGYRFRRSDGQRFFMIVRDDGSASLHARVPPDTLPQGGIVDFSVNTCVKLAAARCWILAYPNKPADG